MEAPFSIQFQRSSLLKWISFREKPKSTSCKRITLYPRKPPTLNPTTPKAMQIGPKVEDHIETTKGTKIESELEKEQLEKNRLYNNFTLLDKLIGQIFKEIRDDGLFLTPPKSSMFQKHTFEYCHTTIKMVTALTTVCN